MELNSFCLNEAYYLKTNNEYICDEIIGNSVEYDFVLINCLSEKRGSISLPRYKDDHILKLKKSGILPYYGIGDLQFLKYLIENETNGFNFIIFGLTGLSHDAVTFLKDYFISLKENSNKIFVLVDYDPSNDNLLENLCCP